MNRIDSMFNSLRQHKRTALVPYIACGHPAPTATVAILHELVDAGADLIELGVPFSDPMADGPVIQKACESALSQGVTVDDVLSSVAEFRRQNQTTPLILMGYMNPIEKLGVEAFAERCSAAGVDGVLVVDLPPEEADALRQPLRERGLHQILLVAPTSPPARVETICKIAGGFLYYVSLKGITGAATLAAEQVATALRGLKSVTAVPVGVGFGIKSASDAVALSRDADAVVIGSALVSALEEAGAPDAAQAAGQFLRPIRQALDEADDAAAAA